MDIIDQTKFPHVFETVTLRTPDEAAVAIKDMLVRGAPLIGVTAAYGMALAMRQDASDAALAGAYDLLVQDRPTAINLKWALDEMMRVLSPCRRPRAPRRAYARAAEIADEDVAINQAIGRNGFAIIKDIAARKKPGRDASTSSPIAMPAGWRRWTGARRRRRSTRRMMRGFPSMSGWTRPGRATRAPRSPPGNCCTTACRIR